MHGSSFLVTGCAARKAASTAPRRKDAVIALQHFGLTTAIHYAAQAVSPKGVQEVLSHSNVSTTLNIYSHLLPSVRQDIADAMDRMLGG